MKREMKKAILSAAVLLAGCSPRVVSEMYTTDYAPQAPDSVRVFLPDEPLPVGTTAIGTVKVKDTGFTTRGGSYAEVLRLAVGETARRGGDALLITEHRAPDLASTIHRLRGTMLHTGQPVDSDMAAQSQKSLVARESDIAEERKQQTQTEWSERFENQPRDFVRMDVGPAWVTSEVLVGEHTYKNRVGLNVLASYAHLWKWGFGLGLHYMHNKTSFEGIDTRINYFGPSLEYVVPLKSFRFDMSMSIGYGRYTESYGSLSGSEGDVAFLSRLGLEYMLNKQVGLGLQYHVFTQHLDEPDGFQLEKDQFYGIRHLGIEIGLRYYF